MRDVTLLGGPADGQKVRITDDTKHVDWVEAPATKLTAVPQAAAPVRDWTYRYSQPAIFYGREYLGMLGMTDTQMARAAGAMRRS